MNPNHIGTNFDNFLKEEEIMTDKQIKLYQGDCLEIMQSIPNNSIDCIICDLPYGTTSCKWDNVIPFDKLWEQYKRIRKDGAPIILFGSEPFSTHLRLSNLKEYKYDWIWEKTRPSGIGFKNQPMRKHENIIVFVNGKIKTFNPIMEQKEANGKLSTRKPWATWNTGKSSHLKGETDKKVCNEKRKPTSVLKFSSAPNFPQNLHPTQKPEALLTYLVTTYTNKGDLVLDNCMGSGTTGVACKKLDRHFIGIELEEKYFKIAEKRIYDR
jgi:site-specific DNA-methyltransferase (adenine-specific)